MLGIVIQQCRATPPFFFMNVHYKKIFDSLFSLRAIRESIRRDTIDLLTVQLSLLLLFLITSSQIYRALSDPFNVESLRWILLLAIPIAFLSMLFCAKITYKRHACAFSWPTFIVLYTAIQWCVFLAFAAMLLLCFLFLQLFFPSLLQFVLNAPFDIFTVLFTYSIIPLYCMIMVANLEAGLYNHVNGAIPAFTPIKLDPR